jgi:hypothetical protein
MIDGLALGTVGGDGVTTHKLSVGRWQGASVLQDDLSAFLIFAIVTSSPFAIRAPFAATALALSWRQCRNFLWTELASPKAAWIAGRTIVEVTSI